MTIPNLISIFRMILVPVFLVFIINHRFLAGLMIFVLAGVSDAADGMVARLFNQKSRLGSYLDPLADKFLLVASFICLAAMHIIPIWLTAIVIARDILILLGSLVLFLINRDHEVKPSIWGKATTFLQLATVFLVLVEKHFQIFSQYVYIVYGATGTLTISSGLLYMRSWFLNMKKTLQDRKGWK
jgi:cardiolipin synthase